jgi:hypothetical protein
VEPEKTSSPVFFVTGRDSPVGLTAWNKTRTSYELHLDSVYVVNIYI